MEFNEKLQELRRQKGLTQEQLAEKLFISRTAVSKWEQGKGYPSIESLKAIANFFSVTVDELLSANELLNLADEESKKKSHHIRDLLFGLFDIFTVSLLFLPFFAEKTDGVIKEVSLLSLTSVSTYLTALYFILVGLTAVLGVLTLALQNCKLDFWVKLKSKASIILSLALTLVFIISLQPYAAVFVLCVMWTALMQLGLRIKNKALKTAVSFIITAFIVFMVIGRLLSGVHWLSDIIGGILLSAGLVNMYSFVCGLK